MLNSGVKPARLSRHCRKWIGWLRETATLSHAVSEECLPSRFLV